MRNVRGRGLPCVASLANVQFDVDSVPERVMAGVMIFSESVRGVVYLRRGVASSLQFVVGVFHFFWLSGSRCKFPEFLMKSCEAFLQLRARCI